MPSSCVVSSCSNRYNHGQNVSFHKFPTDTEICHKWVDFSERSGWKPTRWSSICSRHFEKHCFKEYLTKKCLRPDAVPTIKDISSDTQSSEHIQPIEVPAVNKESTKMDSIIRIPSLLENMHSTIIKSQTRITPEDIENATITWEVPENDLKNDQIYEEEVVTSTAVSQQNDADFESRDQDFQYMEYTDSISQEDEDANIEAESIERLCEILCRLCGGTFIETQLVCYSSFLNLIIKCFPTLNLETYEYFPKQICVDCREKLINFSIFIDKTMAAQKYLTDRLVYNLPNITENFFDNKKIMPRIKQEPIVIIKEEKVDKKIDFSNKTKSTVHTLRDKITFKDSKNCEIIKIINLNKPLLDLRSRQSSPQKKHVEPAINNPIPKRILQTTQNQVVDDDVLLVTTPLKVEEIIETDEIEESRNQQHALVMKIDHNYSRSEYPGKIEILEERVYKTETIDAPFVKMEEPTRDLNRLCSTCNFIFDSSNALKRHNEENHPLKIPMNPNSFRVCTLCNVGFSSVYKYLVHKLSHSRQRTYICRYCQKLFMSRILYFRHVKYKCSLKLSIKNKYIYQEPIDLHDHKITGEYTEEVIETNSTQDNFNCANNIENCIEEILQDDFLESENYFSANEVTEYIENARLNEECPATDSSLFNCSKCGRKFARRHQLVAHESNHRPPEQWDQLCSFCNQVFDHSNDLHWHAKYTCPGVRESRISLPANNQLFYICRTCGARLVSLWGLKNHENIHTRRFLYKCQVSGCTKEFISKQNLAQHQLSHSNEKNYSCTICEKQFKRASGLAQHVNGFHLNIRPHVCSVCKKAYALKADMRRCKHSLLRQIGTTANFVE